MSMRLFEGTPYDRPPRCERCGQLEAECCCPPLEPARTPPNRQRARIGLEKRKRSKHVTVVRDLADEGSHLADLLSALKTHCGAGGTVRDGLIEIQGDQRDKVRTLLGSLGYRVAGPSSP